MVYIRPPMKVPPIRYYFTCLTLLKPLLILFRYSSNGLYLTTDDLLIFLETEQGVCDFIL